MDDLERGSRRLAWADCLNARDLGGYQTRDGRETAWRAVVRADSLSRLTPVGCAALEAYGVRTIVDLRLATEIEEQPNPFAAAGAGIAYHNLSLIDPAAGPSPGYAALADDYKGMIRRFAGPIGEIMTAIARARVGGIVVHCAGGRDRTGVVAAFLLSLAGVPPAIVAADYALSSEYLRPRDEEWLANGPGDRADRERRYAWSITHPEVMLELLAHLEEDHGGVESYLRAGGVAAADIDRLRRRLLDA